MTTVSWVKYREYAGCKINGVGRVAKPTSNLHMDHAYYLTALIEAPYYGAVQSYDGAAMSAGPLHNIAVYPRTMTQGSLFSLLRAIEIAGTKSAHLLPLWQHYSDHGCAVTRDGVLRNIRTGQEISGKYIRDIMTPINGRVPRGGELWEKAKKWALVHHNLFADPATYDAQKQFAIEWLLRSQRALESTFYCDRDPRTLKASSSDFSLEEDLAMSVYHCYSVNAPAPARDDLIAALRISKTGAMFARTLIGQLANTAFGNWALRYVRTRKAAMDSGLWPSELFVGSKAVFPAK